MRKFKLFLHNFVVIFITALFAFVMLSCIVLLCSVFGVVSVSVHDIVDLAVILASACVVIGLIPGSIAAYFDYDIVE